MAFCILISVIRISNPGVSKSYSVPTFLIIRVCRLDEGN